MQDDVPCHVQGMAALRLLHCATHSQASTNHSARFKPLPGAGVEVLGLAGARLADGRSATRALIAAANQQAELGLWAGADGTGALQQQLARGRGRACRI